MANDEPINLDEERQRRRAVKATRGQFDPIVTATIEQMDRQIALYAAMQRHPAGKGRING